MVFLKIKTTIFAPPRHRPEPPLPAGAADARQEGVSEQKKKRIRNREIGNLEEIARIFPEDKSET